MCTTLFFSSNTNATTEKRVAIVTGASSGMGLGGITQALLQHGYRVVANSRHISFGSIIIIQ